MTRLVARSTRKPTLGGIGEEDGVAVARVPEDKAAIGEITLLRGEALPGPRHVHVGLESVDGGGFNRDGDARRGALVELELEGLGGPRKLVAVLGGGWPC